MVGTVEAAPRRDEPHKQGRASVRHWTIKDYVGKVKVSTVTEMVNNKQATGNNEVQSVNRDVFICGASPY